MSQILEIPYQNNWDHFQYLGLPITKKNMKTKIWSKYAEKIKTKIKAWGML